MCYLYRSVLPAFLLAASMATAVAAESASLNAKELAAKLSAARTDGASLVRMRMEVKQPPGTVKTALQIQIKERRTRAGTDTVYEVLWPKERKGEAVILHGGGGKATTGYLVGANEKPRPIGSASQAVFGSDLSYQDLVENFFVWQQQTLAGEEAVGRVNCVILESKPGGRDQSIYSSVKSWIDARRLVPMRVEKYSGGKLVRRIDTTKVASDDRGHPIPANLEVRGPRGNSVTELDGSRIKHDVDFKDEEFTPEGIAASAER
jgi:hypothetical protein